MEESLTEYIFNTLYIIVSLLCVVGVIALTMAFMSLFFKRNKVKILSRTSLGLLFLFLSLFFSTYLPLSLEQEKIRSLLFSVNLFFLLVFCALLFDSFIKISFWSEVTSHKNICTVPPMVINLTSFFIFLMTSFLILRYVFGQPITALAALSGSFIFILGLGAQAVASDFFSGLALSFSRNIRIGDLHLLENNSLAKVTEANWRSVTFEAGSGQQLIYPNTELAKKKLNNLSWAGKKHHRWGIPFQVDTGNIPPSVICQNLEKKASESPFISDTPAPVCHTHKINELGINFLLHVYTKPSDWWKAHDDAVKSIWQVVNDLGLHLSFKNKIKHNETYSIENFKTLHNKVEKKSLSETLASNVFFKDLETSDIQELIKKSTVTCYEAPDSICIQGDEADSLYLIIKGEVSIYVRAKGAGEIKVAHLKSGEFFGHASFLLGQKRNASARVPGFCQILVISKESFKGILEKNSSLAETLAHEASLLEKENNSLLDKDKKEKEKEEDLQSIKKRFLQGIKKFYHLT